MKRTIGLFGAICLLATGAVGCSRDSLTQELDPSELRRAAFTTCTQNDGCMHGGSCNNCNLYSGRDKVFMNGGPIANVLDDGEYFFVVLEPGHPHDFNDGLEGNLSCGPDSCADPMENRIFNLKFGKISYNGTHAQGTNPAGKQVVGLAPFDETSNPGGVYILAICEVEAQGPQDCKYDAFKVKEAEQPPEQPPGEQPPGEQPPTQQPPGQQPPPEQPPTQQPPAQQPPKDEQPPAQQPPKEQPPAEQPPAQEPPKEQPPAEQPPAQEPPKEEPPVVEPPKEEPPVEEPPAQEPPKQEPPAEEPPKEEPPTQEPPVQQPPKGNPGKQQPPPSTMPVPGEEPVDDTIVEEQ